MGTAEECPRAVVTGWISSKLLDSASPTADTVSRHPRRGISGSRARLARPAKQGTYATSSMTWSLALRMRGEDLGVGQGHDGAVVAMYDQGRLAQRASGGWPSLTGRATDSKAPAGLLSGR